MGCEHCSEFFREEEIVSKNKDNKNCSLKDLEPQDIIITEKGKSNKKIRNISRILTSSSKDVNKIKNTKFNLEVLDEINKYRLIHGVEELVMDENINKISQKYAEKMARESELELSGNKFKEKELGEIIFSCKEDISPKELVDIWYNNGSKNYDYKKEPIVCSNFTQLIWKNSKQFGLGHILTRDNTLYVVANFYPEGNIKEQFLKNVFPIVKERKYSKSEENDNSSYYSMTTKFIEEALSSHNEIREKHNSPPLILNPTLSTLAQNHSEFLAKEKKLSFSNNKLNKEKIGENLFVGNKNYNGEEVTSFWYKGNIKYNFRNLNDNNYDDIEINNFTQLIWKNTKEVGFGLSYDKKGNFYVVANYFPCGNIEGQYQYNVLPY